MPSSAPPELNMSGLTGVSKVEGEAAQVACGTAVSYAVTKQGVSYSWGMGTNGQLGTGEEDDLWDPTVMK